MSLGNDKVRSHEQLVIAWQLPQLDPGGIKLFGEDTSADLRTTNEKALSNVWSGQPQQVQEEFKYHHNAFRNDFLKSSPLNLKRYSCGLISIEQFYTILSL